MERFSQGMAWLSTGIHEYLLAAATFIKVAEDRQGLKIFCPEEIAYRMKLISTHHLEKKAWTMKKERLRPVPAGSAGKNAAFARES